MRWLFWGPQYILLGIWLPSHIDQLMRIWLVEIFDHSMRIWLVENFDYMIRMCLVEKLDHLISRASLTVRITEVQNRNGAESGLSLDENVSSWEFWSLWESDKLRISSGRAFLLLLSNSHLVLHLITSPCRFFIIYNVIYNI